MIQKDKLVKVPLNRRDKGVSEQQKKNLAEAGLEMAKKLGIDTEIPELQAKK